MNAATPGHGSPCEGMTRDGREFREDLLLFESTEFRFTCLDCRVLFLLLADLLILESSSEDTSYRSSNSVASVVKLSLVQGADEGVGETLSVSEDDVERGIGADMKWLPLGVGK